MSDIAPPLLGNLFLSGCTSIILRHNQYVIEHPLPNMEGGLTEKLGWAQPLVEIHGILLSGDANVNTLLNYVNKAKLLIMSGNLTDYFVRAGVRVNDVTFYQMPGAGFPYYRYTIRLTDLDPSSLFSLSGLEPALPAQSLSYSLSTPNTGAMQLPYNLSTPNTGAMQLPYITGTGSGLGTVVGA